MDRRLNVELKVNAYGDLYARARINGRNIDSKVIFVQRCAQGRNDKLRLLAHPSMQHRMPEVLYV